MRSLIAPTYVNLDPLHPHPARGGPEGLKPIVRELRAQSPGLHFEVVDLVVEGDLLAAHHLVHGAGPWPVRQVQLERFEMAGSSSTGVRPARAPDNEGDDRAVTAIMPFEGVVSRALVEPDTAPEAIRACPEGRSASGR